MGGGKKKDRTKGSAKPSSSTRSAHLLESSSGFIGFGVSKESSFSLLDSFVFGDDVPGKVKAAFKKMSKKDETTRLKAVIEFSELFQDVQEPSVKAILPHWPRTYSKLSNDNDRRIRTAAQQANLIVVRKSGRNLAPILKDMASSWFLSRYDPHPPSANIAKEAFNCIFPSENKLKDAVNFCLLEIMTTIEENVLNQTPQTLKDPNMSSEEAENKYHRVVSSSLYAYAYLLENSNNSFSEMKDAHERIMDSTKFWRYSKNKNILIRSAWFTLCCKIVEVSKEKTLLNEKDRVRLIQIVFSYIGDRDIVVVPIIWDCALHIMSTYPDWKSTLKIKEDVVPNVIEFLDKGCCGIEKSIYPKLLPFLNNLPDETLNSIEFQKRILLSIRSMKTPNKYCSGTLFFKTYFELCRFFDRKMINKVEENFFIEDIYEWFKSELNDTPMETNEELNLQEESKIFSTFSLFYLPYILSSNHWIEIKCLVEKALEVQNINFLSKIVIGLSALCESKDCKLKETQEKIVDICSSIGRHQLYNIKCDSHQSLMLVYNIIETHGNHPTFFQNLINKPSDFPAFDFILYLDSLPKISLRCRIIALTSLYLMDPTKVEQFDSNVVCGQDVSLEWFRSLISGICHLPFDKRRPDLFKKEAFVIKFSLLLDSLGSAESKRCQNEDSWKVILNVYEEFGKFLPNRLLEKIIFVSLKIVDNCTEVKDNSDLTQNVEKTPHELGLIYLHRILEALFFMEEYKECLRSSPIQELLVSIIRVCNSPAICDKTRNDVIESWSKVMRTLHSNARPESKEIMMKFICSIRNSAKEMILGGEAKRFMCFWSLLQYVETEEYFRIIVFVMSEISSNLAPEFPYEELIFEKDISYLKRMNNVRCDFLSEVTCRNRFLSFYLSLVPQMAERLEYVDIDETFLDSVGLIAFNFVSIKSQQTNNLPIKNMHVLLEALPLCKREYIINGVTEKSKISGGIWSLALGTLYSWSNVDEISSTSYADSHLNHLEILINNLCTNEIVSMAELLQDNLKIGVESEDLIKSIYLGSRILPLLEDIGPLANHFFSFIQTCDDSRFLFTTDISDIPWESLHLPMACMDFLSKYLKTATDNNQLTDDSKIWDMMLCRLSSWVQTIDESRSGLTERYEVQRFTERILLLVEQTAKAIVKLKSSLLSNTLNQEWKEFYSEGISSVLINLFVTISETKMHRGVFEGLSRALKWIPDENIVESSGLAPKFCSDDVDSEKTRIPENLLFVINHLGPLLLSSNSLIQLTSSDLLFRVMNKVSEYESSKTEISDCDKLPFRIVDILNSTEPVAKNIFAEVEFGENVVLPDTENVIATVYIRAYLHICHLILRLVSTASQELRPSWTEYLQQRDFLDTLVPVIFSLMHIDDPGFKYNIEERSQDLSSMAFNLYHDLLKFLPAMFRQWWNLAENRISGLIEKFTILCVSPILWDEEVQHILSNKTSFDNMTIKVHSSVREVVAVYTMDDKSMELVVQVQNNFPLSAVNVDSGRKIGVGNSQWRNWMLQLTTFLHHQNGSILEGLLIWKKNVDKRFEGVEECYICFFILHGSNHQLPKMACRTCKKKFHSHCLYKWFSTSSNFTCPLCRNFF